MSYLRSFFFKFVDDDEDEDEVELLALLGEKEADPSTLCNRDFVDLIQYGQPVSNIMKIEFHRLLSSVAPHIHIPPLAYWLKAHQLILAPADTIHRDRLKTVLWKEQTVTVTLDLGDVSCCAEEANERLNYAPVENSDGNTIICMRAMALVDGLEASDGVITNLSGVEERNELLGNIPAANIDNTRENTLIRMGDAALACTESVHHGNVYDKATRGKQTLVHSATKFQIGISLHKSKRIRSSTWNDNTPKYNRQTNENGTDPLAKYLAGRFVKQKKKRANTWLEIDTDCCSGHLRNK